MLLILVSMLLSLGVADVLANRLTTNLLFCLRVVPTPVVRVLGTLPGQLVLAKLSTFMPRFGPTSPVVLLVAATPPCSPPPRICDTVFSC